MCYEYRRPGPTGGIGGVAIPVHIGVGNNRPMMECSGVKVKVESWI
jgi:hypothetical protein